MYEPEDFTQSITFNYQLIEGNIATKTVSVEIDVEESPTWDSILFRFFEFLSSSGYGFFAEPEVLVAAAKEANYSEAPENLKHLREALRESLKDEDY